uniref:Uncharacterized protein n=1 Tax=Cannabis sativa TaxID=3483 RepID=A0A803QAT8_CANSA
MPKTKDCCQLPTWKVHTQSPIAVLNGEGARTREAHPYGRKENNTPKSQNTRLRKTTTNQNPQKRNGGSPKKPTTSTTMLPKRTEPPRAFDQRREPSQQRWTAFKSDNQSPEKKIGAMEPVLKSGAQHPPDPPTPKPTKSRTPGRHQPRSGRRCPMVHKKP